MLEAGGAVQTLAWVTPYAGDLCRVKMNQHNLSAGLMQPIFNREKRAVSPLDPPMGLKGVDFSISKRLKEVTREKRI